MVAKCNEDVVAKEITDSNKDDTTEYTAIQYLSERVPDIPASRPHGLIRFGPPRVILMSYTLDMTLAQIWPSLSHEEKDSIQHQLDDIFHRLRIIRQENNQLGVNREGMKEFRHDECARWKILTLPEIITIYSFPPIIATARLMSNSSALSWKISVLPCADLFLRMVISGETTSW